eukprot:Blabericola_migrator_1__957@NODE_123_length_13376_cov_72_514539_g109_i0_p4_GENE_NODE_123_length_13376_cov_72_514539_g109_i0NODE_123_length_13376_cov_72_514539_g109_i0_p4_ORF_typecomplete_len453_score69_93_NODE_123_length_13376_cov_72_514539_g109_i01023211590
MNCALLVTVGVSREFRDQALQPQAVALMDLLSQKCLATHDAWTLSEAKSMSHLLQGSFELVDILGIRPFQRQVSTMHLTLVAVLCHRAQERCRLAVEPLDIGTICLSELETNELTALTAKAELLISDIAYDLLTTDDPSIPQFLTNAVKQAHIQISQRPPEATLAPLAELDAAVFCIRNLAWGMADQIDNWKKVYIDGIRNELTEIAQDIALHLGGNESDASDLQWQRAFTLSSILMIIPQCEVQDALPTILNRLCRSLTPNRPINLKQILLALNPFIDKFGANLMSDMHTMYAAGEPGLEDVANAFPVDDLKPFLTIIHREALLAPWLMLLFQGFQVSSEESYKSRLLKCLANTIKLLSAEHASILNNFISVLVIPKMQTLAPKDCEFVYNRLCDDFAGLLAAAVPILHLCGEGRETNKTISSIATSMSSLQDNRALLLGALRQCDKLTCL